jgi:pimeloyl-ACP methyl ester carboxylesterase
MSMLRELRAVGMAALQFPHALRRHGCGSAHYVSGRNAHYPVLLVHGYAGTASVWAPLRRALADADFGHIVSLNYNSFAVDPVAVSAELTRQALRAVAASSAPRVHLIGHSLGGLIVRAALAASPGLRFRTRGPVTRTGVSRGPRRSPVRADRVRATLHQ